MKTNEIMKRILPFFILIFLMGSTVSAAGVPWLAFGKVTFNGVTYADQKIEIYSPAMDYTWETTTNGNGIYQIVFNNLKDDQGRELREGDTVYLDACPVDVNSNCRKEVKVSSNPQEINWGVDVSNAAISEDAVDIKDYVPPEPVIIEVPGDCDECIATVCPECEDCIKEDTEDNRTLFEIIAGCMIGLGGIGAGYIFKRKEALSKGVGIKIYTKNDGSEGVFHKHPGIVGYHDPSTSHRTKKERHPREELAPKYEKDASNEWAYVG